MYKKTEGQVMTPEPIVKIILDEIGYNTQNNVLNKKILEPSFGEGVFLIEIIRRIITESKKSNLNPTKIIEQNVFGIEKDTDLYNIAISNITQLLKENNLDNIDLSKNLLNTDTLEVYTNYLNYIDFVVGNPPYVEPKQMNKNTLSFIKQNFEMCKGKTDLFIAFYDMGLQMLTNTGKLGFITPNSFLKNSSQTQFRDYLINTGFLSKIFDFKTSKIFDASTYTCICILDRNNQKDTVEYREYDMYDITEKTELPKDYFSFQLKGNPWILSSKENIDFLIENNLKQQKLKNFITVQNAVETNMDNVYIHKIYTKEGTPYLGKHTDPKQIVYINKEIPVESTILHRCVKASTFNGKITNLYIIFPYFPLQDPTIIGDVTGKKLENNYISIKESILKKEYPLAYSYLLSKKTELDSRDRNKEEPWYLFARSQGILNSFLPKIIFKHIMDKNLQEITAYKIEKDVIIYSGLYTTLDVTDYITPTIDSFLYNEELYQKDFEKILQIFNTKEFTKYLTLIGKDKNNGYISTSTKDILNYGLPDTFNL